MISPIFQFLEELITQFSWRKLMLIFATLFIAIIILVTYETYTGHFRLNRDERATNLLKEFIELSPKVSEMDNKDITESYKGLTHKLNTYVNHRYTAFSLPSWLLKALASTAPWVLIFIITMFSSSEDTKLYTIGIVIIAIPCIIIGAIIPDIKYPLLNYLAYPICSTALAVSIIMFWNKLKTKKA